MKNIKRIIAILLALSMMAAFTACSGGDTTTQPPDAGTGGEAETAAPDAADTGSGKVLVIGTTSAFSEKWNPFLAENASDKDVMDQVFAPIQMLNADNELDDYAGTCTAELLDNGHVLYTITVNQGMTFTDGQPVTIDDYIYGVYVRSDPSYTGPNNTWSSKILGIQEYLYDTSNYAEITAEIEARVADVSFEDFLLYAKDTDLDGWWDGGEWAGADYSWIDYINDEGYEAELAAIDAEDTDAVFELVSKIEYENYLQYYDAAEWLSDYLSSALALENLESGVDVPEIAGITHINDYTCTVEFTELNIYGDRDLALSNGLGYLVPKHYYGDYEKGDVSHILSNMEPMGSGAYIWGGFSDNIVTLKANNDYFLGAPATSTVRWQYVPDSELLELMASGVIDISEPSASLQNMTEMDSLGLGYELMENDGYGYMGMNCAHLSYYVRKGIWSVMNRDPSVEAYYGTELAKVIERPMTTVLAEYPDDAERYYEYSREKALEYFELAGYSQVGGKLVNEAGEQLIVNVYIGGEGEGNHPAYAMLVQAAEDMASLGAELQIQDVNFTVLMAAVDDGTADMWTMAWVAVNSCDKTTIWHSTGGQNKSKFANDDMDDLLEKIPQTLDLDERRVLVAEMLDLAMDYCVEYPLYQRNNVVTYNLENLNMDTVPTATTFYRYKNEIWKIEVN